MKNKLLFFQLLIIGFLFTAANSCKKDDEIIKKDDPIIKKNAIITWSNPANINSGTPLSASQLNATADVPGNFVYTPGLGEILNVGTNQNLKVDFQPTDAATYNTVSKTVKINVDGGISSVVFNPGLTYGIMTDQNGNTYKTITIGTQTWMAENLRATKYRNGDPIPNIGENSAWATLTSGAYCNYESTSDINQIATYGRLYNWFAIADSRNIAPTGWHVPSDAELTTLITFLNGESIAGGKMKETGTTHWASPNTGAANESGFSAPPAGYRDFDGTFNSDGYYGYWWSSDESSSTKAWVRYLYYNFSDAKHDNLNKSSGFSVRCLRD
jgi:uncharacterized protein (TIGR02145 family)